MPIPVTCACGKKFAAKEELAGKRLKCPACGGAIAIPQLTQPKSQPAAAQPVDPLFANDPFGSDPAGAGGGFDLGNLGQFDAAPASPLGAAPAGQFGAPAAGGAASAPPAKAFGGSAYGASPYGQAQAAKPATAAKSGPSMGLILGLAGGGVALLLILVIGVVCIFAFSGSGSSGVQVAQNNSPAPMPGGNSPGGGAPGGLAPGGVAPGGLTPGGGPPGGVAPGGIAPGGVAPGGIAPGGVAPGPSGIAPGGAGFPPSAGTPGFPPSSGNNPGFPPSAGTPGNPVNPAGSGFPPGAGTPGSPVNPAGPNTAGPGSPRERPKGAEALADSGKPLPGSVTGWHGKANAALLGSRPIKGGDELVLNQYSWMCEILPHLGYEKLYNEFDFKRPWTDAPNFGRTHTVIPQFLNPADSRKRWRGYPFHGLGLSHFVGMSGVEDARNVMAADLPRSDPRAGVFGYREIAKASEITDGTSNTIMLIGSGELAGPWVQGGGATIRGARAPYFDSLSGFGSKSGPKPGALTMFADGSIRHLSADIDPKLFRALCTIHGAETVDLAPLGAPLADFPK